MKNKKKQTLDVGTLVLTGIISVVLTFSLLMLVAIVMDSDITLWDKTKAVPLFIGISGLFWWYFWTNGTTKECKRLKKA